MNKEEPLQERVAQMIISTATSMAIAAETGKMLEVPNVDIAEGVAIIVNGAAERIISEVYEEIKVQEAKGKKHASG